MQARFPGKLEPISPQPFLVRCGAELVQALRSNSIAKSPIMLRLEMSASALRQFELHALHRESLQPDGPAASSLEHPAQAP